jgi:hypothetical protein
MQNSANTVECRCGIEYLAGSITKTRHFICAECGMDLRALSDCERAANQQEPKP